MWGIGLQQISSVVEQCGALCGWRSGPRGRSCGGGLQRSLYIGHASVLHRAQYIAVVGRVAQGDVFSAYKEGGQQGRDRNFLYLRLHVDGQLAQCGFVRQIRAMRVEAGCAVKLRGQRDLRVGLAGTRVFILRVLFGACNGVLHKIVNGHSGVAHSVHE